MNEPQGVAAVGSALDPAARTLNERAPFVCLACSGSLSPWMTVSATDARLGDSFRLHRCDRCGSARTAGDLPTGLYETGTYQPVPPRGRRAVSVLARIFALEKVRILRAVTAPPARVLDVGAGRGRFVAAARAAGYEASGIEPSAQGTEIASTLGAPVSRSTIAGASIEPASLDVATLWHVLEHLEEPEDAIGRIRGWLRPGGSLLAAVPNLASLQAGLGGSRWFHLDVPRHRTHFTPNGLATLLRAAGYEPFMARHLLLEHNPLGMWQTGVNRLTLTPAYLYNLLKRNARVDVRDIAISIAAMPLIPFACATEWVAGAAGHGGTMVIGARRR